MPDPTITDLKAYVPAKDFELSKRFYSALGFRMSEGFGGTADFELGGHRLRLQDYYVKDWANNFMILLDCPDVAAWRARALAVTGGAEGGAFPGVRVGPIEAVDNNAVLHIHDPSGVLLIFVQNTPATPPA